MIEPVTKQVWLEHHGRGAAPDAVSRQTNADGMQRQGTGPAGGTAMAPLSQHELRLLHSAVFATPKERTGAMEPFLDAIFGRFLRCLASFDGALATAVRSRRPRIEALCCGLREAYRLGADGVDSAVVVLTTAIDGVREPLLRMSTRHCRRVLPDQSWYRLAAWGARQREHMFHCPFERLQRPYRFSVAGLLQTPVLYLANSVYLCWLECGRPDIDRCMVSRFEFDRQAQAVLDVSCMHAAYMSPLDLPDLPGMDPRNLMNSPFEHDVVAELADYLSVWPLLASTTLRRIDESGSPPEYVLSQLLMQWLVRQPDVFGLRYFTSKDDESTNSQDWSINMAIPARSRRDTGFCDVLISRVELTQPQALADVAGVADEAPPTDEAADRRQSKSGRVMSAVSGQICPYPETVFGKMEYRLDRPDIGLHRLLTT